MSKHSSQIPTSYFSIGILPKYSFDVESYTVGNPWEEIAINSIVNSYFDLIFKDLLVLDLISEGRKIFFNRIDWKLAEYQIRLSSTYNKDIEFAWLESKIVDAIIDEVNNETFSLKGSIVKLINSILPDPVNYINPSKQVIAKIVTESNSNLWSFESKDLKRLFVGPSILYKLKIELSEKNKHLIIGERRKFEELLKIETKDIRTKKLHYTLFKLVKKQINSRVDLD